MNSKFSTTVCKQLFGTAPPPIGERPPLPDEAVRNNEIHEDQKMEMDEILKQAEAAAKNEDKRIKEEIKLVKNLMTNFNKNKYVHSFAWYITSITNYQAKSPEEMKFLENPFKDGDFAHNHTLWATGEYITNSSELNETNKYNILLDILRYDVYF